MDSSLKIYQDELKLYESLIKKTGEEIQKNKNNMNYFVNKINEQNSSQENSQKQINEVKIMFEEQMQPLINQAEKYKQKIKDINDRIEEIQNLFKKNASIDQNQEDDGKQQNSEEYLDQNSIETSNSSDKKNNEGTEELTVLTKQQIQSSQSNNQPTMQEIDEELDIKQILKYLQKQIKDNKEESYQQLQMKEQQFQDYQNSSIRQFELYKNEMENYKRKLEDTQKKLEDLSNEYEQSKKNAKASDQLYESDRIKKDALIMQQQTQIELMKIDIKELSQMQALRLRSQLVTILYDYIAGQYSYNNFQELYQDKTAFEQKEGMKFNQAILLKAIQLGLTEKQWEIFVEYKNQRNNIFHPDTKELIKYENVIISKLESDMMGEQLIFQEVFNIFMKKIVSV